MLDDEFLESPPTNTRRPELDFKSAELRADFSEWPAGTVGVIVDAFESDALVEIADKEGQTLDLLSVPYSALKVRGEDGALVH